MVFRKKNNGWILAGALLAASGGAMASGFGLLEQNASGLGNSYAGGAAAAEDASTIFFNPAGMTRLKGKQLLVAANGIQPTIKFSGTGQPGTDMGGDAGRLAVVPSGYFAMEINPQWRVGVGFGVPFGLQTEYSPTWVGRAHAIKSKIETINLNPSVAYQVNDSVSLGAGINYQRIRGELTSAVGTSTSSMTGSDSAWGYNFGALVNVSPSTRVGVAYRSDISYNLNGRVNFTAPLAFLSGPASLAVKMPASFSASVFHQIDSKWDVMADATWVGWSVFKELRVRRPSGAAIPPVPENWHDTWRVSVGGNYHYNDQWTSRMGMAYEQTPVPDAYRTARIPDNTRLEIAFGGQYKPNRDSAIDFGYAHLFINNASINSTIAAPALTGTYTGSVDILGVQYAYGF
ncbi:MAG TPA: outer membrane protein transport protein [Gallionella sp.]|nr:outer membrane protein transport protein [Gallionella sp.]